MSVKRSTGDDVQTSALLICPACGEKTPTSEGSCRSCGVALDPLAKEWARERDRLKTMWVVSVVVFWLSLGFQAVLYVLQGKANLLLLSIIGGMLLLGVGLKVRLQLHQRKKRFGRA